MNSILKIIGLFITISLVLFYDHLPQRTLELYPKLTKSSQAALDDFNGGNSTLSWHNNAPLSWTCHIRNGTSYPYCGMYLTWSEQRPFTQLDLSKYSELRVKLDYQGEATYLQIHIRNAYPIPNSFDDLATSKYESVSKHVEDFKDTVTFPFDELRVADWWIMNHNIPPRDIFPELDKVFAVGIDFRAPLVIGDHKFTLHSIAAVGNYFSKETLYLSIISIWILIVFTETLVRYANLSRKINLSKEKITKLVAQSNDYKKQSEIDKLTGIYNRHGLNKAVERLENKGRLHKYSLLVLDIDNFKLVNDENGHQIGDVILKEMTTEIKNNIRYYDIFARWGGEEFVFLFRKQGDSSTFAFAEKLRQAVENRSFAQGQLTNITISIGATYFLPNENFEEAFERADAALYDAKKSGRNKTVIRGK